MADQLLVLAGAQPARTLHFLTVIVVASAVVSIAQLSHSLPLLAAHIAAAHTSAGALGNFAWLAAMAGVQVMQLPLRAYMLLSMFSLRRTPDGAALGGQVRRLIRSPLWVRNVRLGYCAQVLLLVGFVVVVTTRPALPHPHSPLRTAAVDAATLWRGTVRGLSALSLRLLFSTCYFFYTFGVLDAITMTKRGGADEGMIARALTRFAWPPADVSGTEPACAICLDEFAPRDGCAHLPCSTQHAFHEACARRWLAVNASCPLCTRRVDAG